MLTPTKSIEAARLFAIDEPPKYFSSMVQAVLGDASIMSQGVILCPSLTALMAKTAHAECSFKIGTGSQIDPILFVDLSLVELLQVVLAIVLPKFPVISEDAIERLVERILFHSAVQVGAYSVLDAIEPVPSTVHFGKAIFSNDISLRTMVAIDCLVGHELGHWRGQLSATEKETLKSFKKGIVDAAKAGFERMSDAHRDRYSAAELEIAMTKGQSELSYWEGEGWSEIECDLIGLQSAWATAHHLNVPVASLATAVATLFQLTSALGIAGAAIVGSEEAVGQRNLARSVIFESALNEMAWFQGVPGDDWSHSVQFRKRANRRFVDLIGKPLEARVEQLRKVYDEGVRPSRSSLLAAMKRHGFAPRPAGHFYFRKMGADQSQTDRH